MGRTRYGVEFKQQTSFRIAQDIRVNHHVMSAVAGKTALLTVNLCTPMRTDAW